MVKATDSVEPKHLTFKKKTFEAQTPKKKSVSPKTEAHVWQYQQISSPNTYLYVLRAFDTRHQNASRKKSANCCG